VRTPECVHNNIVEGMVIAMAKSDLYTGAWAQYANPHAHTRTQSNIAGLRQLRAQIKLQGVSPSETEAETAK